METLKNESVKEALKKCNPQRAIIALAEITDQFDSGIQNAQNTADQALQDAAAAAAVANEAKQEAAQATVNVGEAFDNTRVTPNSSTVVVEFDRINGNAQNTVLPVVNTTNAGILNAKDYRFFREYDARIRAVEGVSKIYLVELPSDNPSSQQITLAYTSQWPDAPNPPLEGTVVVDPERNNLSYRWNTQSNTWYKISEVAIQQFTNTTLGTIKGSTQDGEVQANADGTGSVTGWDLVKTDTASSLQSLNAVQSPAQIQIQGKNKAGSVVATAAVNVVNDTNAGVMTPAMLTRLNSVGPAIPLLTIDMPNAPPQTSSSDLEFMYSKRAENIIPSPWALDDDIIIYSNSDTNFPIFKTLTFRENGNTNTGTIPLTAVRQALEDVLASNKIKWYGPGNLYFEFKVYLNSGGAIYYYGPDFGFSDTSSELEQYDPWIFNLKLTINHTGIIDTTITQNPDISANTTTLRVSSHDSVLFEYFQVYRSNVPNTNTMKPERYSHFFQWDKIDFTEATETVDIGFINIADTNNNPLVELRVYLYHSYSNEGTQAENFAGIAYQSGNYIISIKYNDLYYSRGKWGGIVPVGTRVMRSNTENTSDVSDKGCIWWRTGAFKISSGSETEMPVTLETMTIAMYNENLTDITDSGSEKVELRLDLTTPNVTFNWLIQPSNTTPETPSRNDGEPSA